MAEKGQVNCHCCNGKTKKFGKFRNVNRIVQRYRCVRCAKTFSETQPLDGLRVDFKQACNVVHLLCEGMGIKRVKQQLLVTGVVYPESVTEDKQHEFEARLFLEINDKQTKTKAELRQAIESIVNPFSVVAISKSVITKLADKEPLCGYLEEHQFDRGKLKSSSIVSYGIRHIVKCEGDDTLFNLWKHDEKDVFAAAVKAASAGKKKFIKPSKLALEDYVQFCAKEINNILIGYKLGVLSISKDLWTHDRKISRAINTTAINGVIFCLRKLLQEKKTKTLEEYKTLFKKLSVDFTPKKFKYRSSHWKSFGEKIFEQCFT